MYMFNDMYIGSWCGDRCSTRSPAADERRSIQSLIDRIDDSTDECRAVRAQLQRMLNDDKILMYDEWNNEWGDYHGTADNEPMEVHLGSYGFGSEGWIRPLGANQDIFRPADMMFRTIIHEGRHTIGHTHLAGFTFADDGLCETGEVAQ
jgi:hypothetical protein